MVGDTNEFEQSWVLSRTQVTAYRKVVLTMYEDHRTIHTYKRRNTSALSCLISLCIHFLDTEGDCVRPPFDTGERIFDFVRCFFKILTIK